MTKAFMIYFKDEPFNGFNFSISSSPASFGTQSCTPYSPSRRDDRPVLVIAKSIDEAAAKYKNAVNIQEIDVKDVIIDERVDIILEKKR